MPAIIRILLVSLLVTTERLRAAGLISNLTDAMIRGEADAAIDYMNDGNVRGLQTIERVLFDDSQYTDNVAQRALYSALGALCTAGELSIQTQEIGTDADVWTATRTAYVGALECASKYLSAAEEAHATYMMRSQAYRNCNGTWVSV